MKRFLNVLFIIFLFLCTVTSSVLRADNDARRKNSGKKVYTLEHHELPGPPERGYDQPVIPAAEREMTMPPFDPDDKGSKSRLMIMWNLVDYLGLDEATAAKFFPVFIEHNNARDKFFNEHRELAEQIIKDVDDESVSVKSLKESIAKLDQLDESIRAERDAFHKKTKAFLNERQYVKLVIFNDKLKRDLFSGLSRRRGGDESSSIKSDEPKDRNPDVNVYRRQGQQEQSLETQKMMLEEMKKRIEILEKSIKEQESQQKAEQKK
ncbi:hypothetical protein LLG96_16505 [bacterium]|nr:hypothetical protein [bacterium]